MFLLSFVVVVVVAVVAVVAVVVVALAFCNVLFFGDDRSTGFLPKTRWLASKGAASAIASTLLTARRCTM